MACTAPQAAAATALDSDPMVSVEIARETASWRAGMGDRAADLTIEGRAPVQMKKDRLQVETALRIGKEEGIDVCKTNRIFM